MPGDYNVRLTTAKHDPDRLQAVYGSAFMNKPPTTRLSAVCHSAAKMLRARASDLVMLTGEEQHVIASWRDGQFFPPAPLREIDQTICQHNLLALEDGILQLDDMTADERVCNLSLIEEYNVRAYLGVPVVIDGHVVGAFCVLDDKVRAWTAMDTMLLTGFAEEAMALASFG